MSALDTLKTFTLENLPDLSVAVEGALELLFGAALPEASAPFKRPLIIGSGNAESAGRIIFADADAAFASESSYEAMLRRVPAIDGFVLISASGGKHAVGIAEALRTGGRPGRLFTNNPAAPAARYFDPGDVLVFPKNREPYTYNASTYLGMILSKTGEDPAAILAFICTHFGADLRPLFSSHAAFTFILPGEYGELRSMLRTKFDELFGPKLVGRFFTFEELKHAKTVVPDPGELFLNFTDQAIGKAGELRLALPPGYAGALATTYFIVGLIQNAQPPYFKQHLQAYAAEASDIFGQDIRPIVE